MPALEHAVPQLPGRSEPAVLDVHDDVSASIARARSSSPEVLAVRPDPTDPHGTSLLSTSRASSVERATRHRLTEHGRARLSSEIDQVLLKENYRPGEIDKPAVGYVFCPEHRTGSAEPLYVDGGEARLWLFGPSMLPDEASPIGGGPGGDAARHVLPPAERDDDTPPIASPAPFGGKRGGDPGMNAEGIVADPSPVLMGATESLPVQTAEGAGPPRSDSTVEIGLGESLAGVPVAWELSIRSNPHLMIVGLPGMGKTTALINICKHLTAAGIVPIIFSYHDDIDEKLAGVVGPMRTVDFDGLGFNPLRVHAPGPTAHIDVAGPLRDIFASIFPDLGEIQLEELRAAIRQSYDDLGWGRRDSERPAPPAFRTFLDILRSRPKPNQNLLARLQELDDYGFFNGGKDDAGLLADARPTLVRVHLSTNDILQRAFAGFVLYSVYKDTFRRGVQDCLTHAVIFDEAHRAAKLKLIPRLAKECRKYGLALGLASQGVRDFDPALFEAIASYLVLRVTEADARTIARNTGLAADQARTADRMKALEPYTAMFSARGVSERRQCGWLADRRPRAELSAASHRRKRSIPGSPSTSDRLPFSIFAYRSFCSPPPVTLLHSPKNGGFETRTDPPNDRIGRLAEGLLPGRGQSVTIHPFQTRPLADGARLPRARSRLQEPAREQTSRCPGRLTV